MAEKKLRMQLRPLEHKDLDSLVNWINAPHVVPWWDGLVGIDTVKAKYLPRLTDDSSTRVYVIQVDNRPVGIVQCYRHADCPDWDQSVRVKNAAGIDYLIGEQSLIGKGIGTNAISEAVKIAFQLYPDVEVVVSVPQKDNLPSWRALEKAGFTRIAESKLDSQAASDAGTSYIYALKRRNFSG